MTEYEEPKEYKPKEALYRSLVKVCHNYYTNQLTQEDIIISIGYLKLLIEIIKIFSDKDLYNLLKKLQAQYYMDADYSEIAFNILNDIIKKVNDEENIVDRHE